MKQITFVLALIAVFGVISCAADDTNFLDPIKIHFGHGPVKPWMLKSCTDEVEKVGVLLGQFANATIERNTTSICENSAQLSAALVSANGNCWIMNKKPADKVNATLGSLETAESLLASAIRVSQKPLPIFDVQSDLEKLITTYPYIVASCN